MTKNYKKIKELGKGGMATVYLARDIATNQLVAVKILKTTILSDKDYIKRFFREARITAQLDHPNIIKVIESNFAEGNFYIVTEYVEGGDFRKLLETSPASSSSDPGLHKKLAILNKVLQALDYAHQKGIVHRDIKPSNILLTRNLEPKLSDFGIATALWGQESRYTRTDEIVGTMDYIAPEQKENSKNVDLRADIYSIGVIMYQLITGRKPMGAFPSPQKLSPAIPDQLDAIVMKCLQPLPADRYKSAHNLSHELEETLEQPLHHTTEKPGQKMAPPRKSKSNDDKTTISHGPMESIKTMVDKLKHGGLTEKLNIKTRFIDFVNPSHQEKLLELLMDSESGGFLQETIIQALGKIKSKKACPFLIELLSDPYYNKLAAEAIGNIGCPEPEAEEQLIKILLTHSEKSYIALIPLGKLHSVKSIDLIAEYLTHRHTWIREMALDALAMMKDNKVIQYLENTANQNSDANIRAKAKKLLWRLKQ